MSLAEDVQITKTDLDEFRDITHRILEYLPNVINEESELPQLQIMFFKYCWNKKTNTPV